MEIEASSSMSQTETVPSRTSTTPPILKLRLHKKKSTKTVGWTNGTVDNENMNRKKSKCCCIYRKPLAFGESSSEEEEECEHCFGHPEKRKKIPKCPEHGHSGTLEPLDDDTEDTKIPDESDDHQCTSGVCRLRRDVPNETNSEKTEENHAEN